LFLELYLFGKKNLLIWGEFLVEYFPARNIWKIKWIVTITHIIEPGSSTQNQVDRDPRPKLDSRRCIPLAEPCSLGRRPTTHDPRPRSSTRVTRIFGNNGLNFIGD
jgi:hypothetical protein